MGARRRWRGPRRGTGRVCQLTRIVSTGAPPPLTVGEAVLGVGLDGRFAIDLVRDGPHALIAGTTGSGKSVALNSMLLSLLYKATPDEVKVVLIDPKRLELGVYDDIPHLLTPVVTDAKIVELGDGDELFEISDFGEIAYAHRDVFYLMREFYCDPPPADVPNAEYQPKEKPRLLGFGALNDLFCFLDFFDAIVST